MYALFQKVGGLLLSPFPSNSNTLGLIDKAKII